MLDVSIKHNPYKVTTELAVNGTDVSNDSPLYFVHDQRLQAWIEPRRHWGGIFQELRKQGESELQLRFHGTGYDFADLEYACKKYGGVFNNVDLVHINRDTCAQNSQGGKIEELRRMYDELQNGPIDEFKTEDIRNAFSSAISSDFNIVVAAPMSSGKSTLLNAILDRDLLPAFNEATTAVITKIRDNDDIGEFVVSARDITGQPIRFQINSDESDETYAEDSQGNYIISPEGKPVEKVPASPKLISQLNYAIDPEDPDRKKALIDELWLEGPIPAIPSDNVNTVFIDTPGGNNSQNEEHERLMEKAIHDEKKSLILYVFNGTQTGTNDSAKILNMIAEDMKRSSNGKQSRDRFLFVANRMDDFDPSKEDYDKYVKNSILPALAKHGIKEPNLFLVSAQLAKLCRMKHSGQKLTKAEKSFLSGKSVLFGDMSDGDKSCCLYQYSAISDSQKAEFDNQIRQLSEQSEDRSTEIAEINSGVPALEAAIRDYVDKYAVSIKLKSAHDTFMKKVNEREMVDSREAAWASSKKELTAVQDELAKKRKRYQESQQLAEYRKKIDEIRVDRAEILSSEAELREKTDRIRSKSPANVKKEQAETVLRKFKSELEETFKDAGESMVKQFNDSVLTPCNIIVTEYGNYLKSLEREGMFDLGGIKVRELGRFRELNVGSIDDMLDEDEYISTRQEKTGTRTYKKSGFFNALKRFFGAGGWGIEDVYESVEYVSVANLIRDKITELLESFHDEIEKNMKDVERNVGKVKARAHERLSSIDAEMTSLLNELNEKVSDEDALKAKVEANKKNLKWMQDFIERVDAILDIQ